MIRATPVRVKTATSVAISCGKPRWERAAVARIFAFRILPDDHPIEVSGPLPAQWSRNSRQYPRRTNICVLVKALADPQAKAPKGDMISYVGRTDGAEINRVMGLELVQPVVGHHCPMRLVVVRTPVIARDIEAKVACPPAQRLENLQPRIDDFWSDSVGRDRCDRISAHRAAHQCENAGKEAASSSKP